jgi:prepilin-type N-terminal cleavage/methylation domain-containing protein
MIKKNSFTTAFTLIELLVVITIIGILAGIALPVFNSVQVKGQQTKCLAQAKQVGLALKLFASDNDGSYPIYQSDVTKAPGSGTASQSNYSNQDFFALFPTYTQSESIFANKSNYYNNVVPDNVIDASGTVQSSTLMKGENSFDYVEGLNDTFNPSSALICDGVLGTSAAYTITKGVPGYDWGTNKAIVIHLDNSGGLDTLVGASTAMTDQGNDPSKTTPTQCNLLLPSSNGSLTGCFLVNPNR